MAAPQPPAATAATMSTLLPLPPLKSLRPFSVPELSWSKKPALVTGGCGSWRFLARKPRLPSVRATKPNKMTEMVRAPDGFGDSSWDGGEAEDGGPGNGEAVVLRNGSLEFRVDLASEGLESTLNKLDSSPLTFRHILDYSEVSPKLMNAVTCVYEYRNWDLDFGMWKQNSDNLIHEHLAEGKSNYGHYNSYVSPSSRGIHPHLNCENVEHEFLDKRLTIAVGKSIKKFLFHLLFLFFIMFQSKWVVAALFGIVILWKHDAEALWVTMGSIINAWLSTQLKQILNHQRPDPALRSDPGMPSSHSQSIFYISTFAVVSLVDSLGFNTLTVSLGALTLACSSYLAWLRVSQKLHTVSQIGVGAVVGSAFCITWFWLWRAFVLEAFSSSIWVRIVVVIGSVAFCVAFLIYVVQHWLRDDE